MGVGWSRLTVRGRCGTCRPLSSCRGVAGDQTNIAINNIKITTSSLVFMPRSTRTRREQSSQDGAYLEMSKGVYILDLHFQKCSNKY